MKSHILKKKIFFIVSIVVLTSIIFFGGLALKNKSDFSYKTIMQKLSYYKYKFIFWGDFDRLIVNSNDTSLIPVLLYHGITNAKGQYNMTQSQFANEMITLKKNGYSTIKINDLYDFLNKRKKLPEKSFLLTFDDARRDSYLGADPILKLLGYNAVMFVPTADSFAKDNNGDQYYLNGYQLEKMIKSGRWELGSHAMQQTGDSVMITDGGNKVDFLSNKMWLEKEKRIETDKEYEARVDKELTQSKIDLEKTFNVPITAFAYPSSDYGQQSTNNDKNAEKIILKYILKNYQMAFQQVSSTDTEFTLNRPGDNMFFLRRIEPGSDWDGDRLLDVLQSANEKVLPAENLTDSSNVWKRIWGTITQNNNGLILTSTLIKSGSGAFLDGTQNWTNYQYQTTVNGDTMGAITLYSRYQDEDNNISCTFTNSYVKISEKVNGTISLLKEVKYQNAMVFKDTIFGVSINNDTILCSLGEKVVLGSNHKNKIKYGGIGFNIWDSDLKERSVVFSDVSAKAVSNLTIPIGIKK